MKQVNILKIWLGITIFFSVPLQATTINPQIGDSVWEVIDRIGQNTDETSSTYTAVRSIETKVDALAVNFKETWTAIEALEGGIISIGATGSTYTINSSGRYKLVEDRANPIIINVDNVCLDLAGFNIIVSSDVDGIKVNSGKTRVKINNGRVIQTGSSTKSGILVESSSSRIKIENVELENFNTGVKFNGDSDSEVTKSEIADCDFVLNATGIQLNYSDKNIIKDCTASKNDQAGFELLHSECNCIFDSQALNNGSATTGVIGFSSNNGSCNLFQRCVAKRNETSDSDFNSDAYGFLLTGTEENTKIIECIANETSATNASNSSDAVAYGIALHGTLLDTPALLNQIDDLSADTSESVAWSPNRKYIAIGRDGNLAIYSFDETAIRYVASTSTNITGRVKTVAWSPDGKYIVCGDEATDIEVFSFNGSYLTHIDGYHDATGVAINSVAWSPDGKYIVEVTKAVFISTSYYTYIQVFGFDGSSLTSKTGTYDISTPDYSYKSISWSPDSKYIALGCEISTSEFRVYTFNGGSTLNYVSYNVGSTVNSVSWSPNGKWIATGDNFLRVFSYDGSSLILESSQTIGAAINSVNWLCWFTTYETRSTTKPILIM